MFSRFRVLETLCLVFLLPLSAQAQSAFQSDDLARILPSVPVRIVKNDARIAGLQNTIKRAQIFDAYRKLTQIYIELGRYDDAAKTLRAEAAQYRRKGLVDAAIIKNEKAAQYETDLRVFVETLPISNVASNTQSSTGLTNAPSTRAASTLPPLARLEPCNGCYLGAFIDRDDALGRSFFDENWQSHHRSEAWQEMTGKAHASYFMYLRYGQKFPSRWVEHLKRVGAIPQIAWEPSNLNDVRDDFYLRIFARDLASAKWPVFVRFASEMNGFWTPYHNNPQLYREKFRLVNRVLHQEAPLAATIWCVGNPPLKNIAPYYPGDDGCDWVGVNFYSVPFHENKRNRPAFDENPLALLDPIYKMFSARKPIAICEYAASHRAAVDNVSRTDFAVDKLSLLYGALPRLYPRVKLIDWFSMNTIGRAPQGKTLSDYSLSGDNRVLNAYRRAINEPYFLSRWNQNAPPVPRLLTDNQTLRNGDRLSIWAKTYVSRPKVYLQVAGKIVYASQRPGAHQVSLDLRQVAAGKCKLTAYLFDDKNRFVRSVSVFANVAKS